MKNISKIFLALFLLLAGTACDKTELYEYPSSDSDKTEISFFSLLNEKEENVIVDSKIDNTAGVITVKVTEGTTLTKLVPRISVSEGVIVKPEMGKFTDFSQPVTYILTAGNRTATQSWKITVSY